MRKCMMKLLKMAVMLIALCMFTVAVSAEQELKVETEQIRSGVVVSWNFLSEFKGVDVFCAVYDEQGRMLDAAVVEMSEYSSGCRLQCNPGKAALVKVFLLNQNLTPVEGISNPVSLEPLKIDFDSRFHAVVLSVFYNEDGNGEVHVLKEDGEVAELIHEKTLMSQKMSGVKLGNLYSVGDADGDGRYEFYRVEFTDEDGDGKIEEFEKFDADLFQYEKGQLFNGWIIPEDAVIFCRDSGQWRVLSGKQFWDRLDLDLGYGYANRNKDGKYALRLAIAE